MRAWERANVHEVKARAWLAYHTGLFSRAGKLEPFEKYFPDGGDKPRQQSPEEMRAALSVMRAEGYAKPVRR